MGQKPRGRTGGRGEKYRPPVSSLKRKRRRKEQTWKRENGMLCNCIKKNPIIDHCQHEPLCKEKPKVFSRRRNDLELRGERSISNQTKLPARQLGLARKGPQNRGRAGESGKKMVRQLSRMSFERRSRGKRGRNKIGSSERKEDTRQKY